MERAKERKAGREMGKGKMLGEKKNVKTEAEENSWRKIGEITKGE